MLLSYLDSYETAPWLLSKMDLTTQKYCVRRYSGLKTFIWSDYLKQSANLFHQDDLFIVLTEVFQFNYLGQFVLFSKLETTCFTLSLPGAGFNNTKNEINK